MYDALSTTELTALQDILYTATEKAFRLANLAPGLGRYHPIHAEVARLFMEAGNELMGRLENAKQRAAL